MCLDAVQVIALDSILSVLLHFQVQVRLRGYLVFLKGPGWKLLPRLLLNLLALQNLLLQQLLLVLSLLAAEVADLAVGRLLRAILLMGLVELARRQVRFFVLGVLRALLIDLRLAVLPHLPPLGLLALAVLAEIVVLGHVVCQIGGLRCVEHARVVVCVDRVPVVVSVA